MRRIALLLTAAIGTVALLAFFYPGMMVNAAEVATRVEGEDFTTRPPTGTSIATDTTLYSNGQALKFSQDVIASHKVMCSAVCDVEVLARAGQTGGSPTLSVNGSTPQTITNNGAPVAYLFNDVNLSAGVLNTISITAGNTGTGHNLFVDFVSFPASGTDTTPPNVTIDSGPGDTSDGAATFTFSADESATFQCKLLQGTTTISNWAACTSQKTYSGLADGDYRFRVRATDSSNNVSVISSLNFTVTNGSGTDTTPPNVTIDSGPGDTSDGAATFTFSADESATFQCKLLQGTTTISNWAACTSQKTYSGLADGDYRFRVRATDSSNNVSVISSLNFTVTNGGGGGESEIIVGAGDISTGTNKDQETGNIIRDQLSRGAWGVFTTGDNAYPDGTYQNYQVYDAAWGSFKSDTRPTYGNHDYYGSETAVGSELYWNEAPATPVQVSNAKSFYAYDVGNSNWKAIVLNSASSEGPTGNLAPPCKDDPAQTNDQMDFLNRELNTTKNTVLFWHHARFSSSSDHPTSEGATGCSDTFFDVAHDNGADLVVQGHSHVYERYHARDTTGAKVTGGLTSLVCGTGGNSFDGLQGSPSPAPDVRFTNAWGVCKLTLNTNSAQVDYLPAPESVEPGSPPDTDSATVAVRP